MIQQESLLKCQPSGRRSRNGNCVYYYAVSLKQPSSGWNCSSQLLSLLPVPQLISLSFLKLCLLFELPLSLDFLPLCWPLILSLIPSLSYLQNLQGPRSRTSHLFSLGVCGFHHYPYARDSPLFLQPGNLQQHLPVISTWMSKRHLKVNVMISNPFPLPGFPTSVNDAVFYPVAQA